MRDLTGTYALAISADAGCGNGAPSPFPDELKRRRYTATVTQTGPAFHVQLSGANFDVKGGLGNEFSGRIEPAAITFELGEGYYTPYPDIIESLADGRILLVTGDGTLSPSGSDLTGSLNGTLYLGKPALWTNGWLTTFCYSPNLTLTMTRQSAAPSRIRR